MINNTVQKWQYSPNKTIQTLYTEIILKLSSINEMRIYIYIYI